MEQWQLPASKGWLSTTGWIFERLSSISFPTGVSIISVISIRCISIKKILWSKQWVLEQGQNIIDDVLVATPAGNGMTHSASFYSAANWLRFFKVRRDATSNSTLLVHVRPAHGWELNAMSLEICSLTPPAQQAMNVMEIHYTSQEGILSFGATWMKWPWKRAWITVWCPVRILLEMV